MRKSLSLRRRRGGPRLPHVRGGGGALARPRLAALITFYTSTRILNLTLVQKSTCTPSHKQVHHHGDIWLRLEAPPHRTRLPPRLHRHRLRLLLHQPRRPWHVSAFAPQRGGQAACPHCWYAMPLSCADSSSLARTRGWPARGSSLCEKWISYGPRSSRGCRPSPAFNSAGEGRIWDLAYARADGEQTGTCCAHWYAPHLRALGAL